jgi:hypothetical protein
MVDRQAAVAITPGGSLVQDDVDPAVWARAVLGEAPFDLLVAGGTAVDVGTGALLVNDLGTNGEILADPVIVG